MRREPPLTTSSASALVAVPAGSESRRPYAGPLWLRAMPLVWSALLAMALAAALARLYGQSPLEVFRLLVAGTWGSSYGIGQVLFKATPLVFTGLAVAVALRAGLFNVGAEGQITVGALATALCAAGLPAGTPAIVALPLSLLCGFAGGAALGALTGLLKWKAGAHEVIVTILLNFVVRALMVGIGTLVFLKESMHTAEVIGAAQLSRLSRFVPALHGSAVNTALLLGVVVTALCGLLFSRTRPGFALRAVGENPEAARAAGLQIGRVQLLAFVLAGGLAGLGGANFVLGYKHYYEDGFSSGVGYLGIAVAVLGQRRPLGVLVGALLFGTLSQGGLAVNALVPRELIDVLSAVVILTVATASPEVRRLIATLPRALTTEPETSASAAAGRPPSSAPGQPRPAPSPGPSAATPPSSATPSGESAASDLAELAPPLPPSTTPATAATRRPLSS
ncbi:MAG: ABC transporter permease [Polyangia bacterium]